MLQPDPATAPERILDAAAVEFAEHGFAGSRVDRIAKRAGCNKQLLYHYFGSKEGLRSAVFRRRFLQRGGDLKELSGEPVELVTRGFDLMSKDENWIRMMLWERLSPGGINFSNEPNAPSEEPDFAEERRARFREHAQRLGSVADPELRPFVTLACMSLSAFPWTLPQMAEMVTQQDVRSDSFRQKYLRAVAHILGVQTLPTATPADASAPAPAAPKRKRKP